MKLYNTLSRKIEEFEPIASGKVGLYACGFTVYDYTHLGHLRKYTMDDVLIRALKHFGFKVEFIQNVTDVGHLTSDADTGEDKLEKGARKYSKTVFEIARYFEDYFFYSMKRMGNLAPDVSCRATEHIDEQIQMVKKLEKLGFTYIIPDDGVYFDISKFGEYADFARLDLAAQSAGERVDVSHKRNSADFALWKFEADGENRAMSWKSPWSDRGFPGWHIECSAMAMKYLGDQFDIHTGGIDHISVHHTNEIAQAQAVTKKSPFVKYWVHHNFLRVEGEKMSKSLNNFFTIDDVIKQGFSPQALRLLFLMAHYRSELNFTFDNLKGAQTGLDNLIKKVNQLQIAKQKILDKKSSQAQDFYERFFANLGDDLDTPSAVALMFELAKSKISDNEKWWLYREFEQVLGLNLTNQEDIDLDQSLVDFSSLTDDVKDLLSRRQKARLIKDFKTSDELRKKIEDLGFLIKDTKDKILIFKK